MTCVVTAADWFSHVTWCVNRAVIGGTGVCYNCARRKKLLVGFARNGLTCPAEQIGGGEVWWCGGVNRWRGGEVWWCGGVNRWG